MYGRRVKIFVIFSGLFLMVCLVRLGQMQLLSASSVQHDIAELKRRRGHSKQLSTVRGRILDRKGRELAIDEARFWVHINYRLSSYLDDRIRRFMLDRADGQSDSEEAVAEMKEAIHTRLEQLQQIIETCAQFRAVDPVVITGEIQKINDLVWDQRMFQAWRSNFPNSEVFDRYDSVMSVPFSVAMADFETKEPDPEKRLELARKVDIAEMRKDWPLLELKTDDDIFAAQLEFMDTDGVRILPTEHRSYPYGTVAAQTIGWVGPATQERDTELFANDRLSRYLDGELCGREDGVEYVCEAVLRGRRGETSSDIDGQLVGRTDIEEGRDVQLTLDIKLQQDIENYLRDYTHDPKCGPGMSVVLMDVATCEILALVSLPTYDLNRARYDYGILAADPNKPLINRAINALYPPGSVVKPLILVAGLETGAITPEEEIDCLAQAAPAGWPDCLIYRRYSVGHSDQWANKARNAIRGSCNIYFSRLADRIDPVILQQWLFEFGYGRKLLPSVDFVSGGSSLVSRKADHQIGDTRYEIRNFDQAAGIISSGYVRGTVRSFADVPPLRERERRMFGMGQGNFRATPLQVANAMAALARGGIFKRPKLVSWQGHPALDPYRRQDAAETQGRDGLARIQNPESGIDLGISPETLAVICDGMRAVVNEHGGTAYRQFEPFLTILAREDVTVYGKTGSTERPEHASFAGFAADSTGRKIAIAVVVEGGQRGSSDAAPLGRDIIQLCIDYGYIGKTIFVDDTTF